MNRAVRIAIALSGAWVIALALFVAVDWLQILPGQCRFDSKNLSDFIGVDRVFFSCDPYSNIPASWWGTTVLHVGDQVIEVHTWRLTVALLPPLVAIWFFAVIVPAVWRWTLRGK